jgi:antitoxin HicB
MAEKGACKLPLVFEPQPEGGFTVTCPVLPELITEGDTIAEVLANVDEALSAIIEAYEDWGREVPSVLRNMELDLRSPFWIEAAVPA